MALNKTQEMHLEQFLKYTISDDMSALSDEVALVKLIFAKALLEESTGAFETSNNSWVNENYLEILRKRDLSEDFNKLSSIFTHPCPQNPTGHSGVFADLPARELAAIPEGYVIVKVGADQTDIVPSGLLNLTVHNKAGEEPVTKKDVVDFMVKWVKSFMGDEARSVFQENKDVLKELGFDLEQIVETPLILEMFESQKIEEVIPARFVGASASSSTANHHHLEEALTEDEMFALAIARSEEDNFQAVMDAAIAASLAQNWDLQ